MACPRAPAWVSSPAVRWRTSRVSPRRGTKCCGASGGTGRPAGSPARPRAPGATHPASPARADAGAVDAHKCLNVPYDCGIAMCAHPEAHRASMTSTAAYLIPSDGDARDGVDWTPEFSRRARGVTAYAALRALGRQGVIDI